MKTGIKECKKQKSMGQENMEKEGMERESRLCESKIQELIALALEQRSYAYAPYSKFKVGAALLSENGQIYTGCNIENAAYGPSNCAERTAIFKAVSEGVRDFLAICVVGGSEEGIKDLCPPCGVCRQVMLEFCNTGFQIILATDSKNYEIHTLGELVPMGFKL